LTNPANNRTDKGTERQDDERAWIETLFARRDDPHPAGQGLKADIGQAPEESRSDVSLHRRKV
jgi:hypothetical protein